MKPSNFPERKRQRRQRALDRLPSPNGWNNERVKLERFALVARTKNSARDERSKKNRSLSARLSRA